MVDFLNSNLVFSSLIFFYFFNYMYQINFKILKSSDTQNKWEIYESKWE